MILYLTQKTIDTYRIKMPYEISKPLSQFVKIILEKETDNSMFEWGGKLFYFNRRKCLQIIHFASKLTLFLMDIKAKDIENLGDIIVDYIYELYKDRPNVVKKLKYFFEASPILCVNKIVNKSIIYTLNHTEIFFAQYGDRFFDYVQDNILNIDKINYDINFNYIFHSSLDKKEKYFFSGELFEKLILENY